MIVQLRDNLYRLDIPLVGNPLKNLNSYLITGSRNLLIDTGFNEEPCRVAMLEQLAELDVDLDCTDIFCTHLHSDHSGLAGVLHRPGCKVFISAVDKAGITRVPLDEYWLELNRSYQREGFSKEEMDKLWGVNPMKVKAEKFFTDYTPLGDGEILEYGGFRLETILTPGHTPGHLCLYDSEHKILFSGDHILFHITPNITRWKTMPDALGSYLESLEKIKDLEVEMLLTGHRYETGNLQQRIAELQKHHAARLENTMTVLRAGAGPAPGGTTSGPVRTAQPGMTAYQIAGAMRWQIRARTWAVFPLAQKYFAVGETLSHLDHLKALGRVRSEEIDEINYWYPLD